MMSYCLNSIENETGAVKMGKSDSPDVEVFEEENYWTTGYNVKVVRNNSSDQVMVTSHTNLDFKNGLMI